MASDIHAKSFLDPQVKPRLTEFLNSMLYRTATLQAGVISRSGPSYAQFVRTTLAYIANAPHLLQILYREAVCAEEEPYDCADKPREIPKKAITPRKPKNWNIIRKTSLSYKH